MVHVYPKTLDTKILNEIYINKNSVDAQVEKILNQFPVSNPINKDWLYRVISMIDLTTLGGDDTRSNVVRLCNKAANPLGVYQNEIKVKTAAVCVYPNRIKDAYETISRLNLKKDIQIASVATGFPSGQYPLSTRLQEIKFALDNGATEIDVVIDRSLVLMGEWETLYDELLQMRRVCGRAHLKVILGVGELGSYENVYNASMVSMMAGADFIKTSTGKEAVNATLPVGLVMCRAIRNYYLMTGTKVGLKPAGGIKTSKDAVNWLTLVYNELGQEWLSPKLFRIGASSLLDVIIRDIQKVQ
ncbi:deoxyribose-phosphate aldolase [Danaus plexippus]|uniref:deoxyribose-phosphate aldolase n=1 Tax=Danaus plexippus TaxID=13037 RepID=UPI002AB1E988|nr:deoxyribose-phosphate aldolase [Danaus plexippus]XP_032511416.2 deoxyribose-phosphate aldolase [Danaus plexippus]